MSESTPIVNSKDIKKNFNINMDDNSKDFGTDINDRSLESNKKQTTQTYNDWRDLLIDDNNEMRIETSSKGKSEQKSINISKTAKKTSKKNKKASNIEMLTRLSPTKLKNKIGVPVLANSQSAVSPLSNRKINGSQSARKQHPHALTKGLSVDPSKNMYNKLTLNTDLKGANYTDRGLLSAQNSVLANYDLIKEVDQNKIDIKEKKQRLRDLEEEIVSISDKMTAYQNETDEIIGDLKERINERESLNQRITEEPFFYCTESTQELKSQDEYTSSDDLLYMLRYGVDKKFKAFLDSCKSDVKTWKDIAKQEVDAFNRLLQTKHKDLQQELTEELSNFTPVLNGKFEIK